MVTNSCQLCGSNNLKQIIDLGNHPLADTFLSEDQIGGEEIFYPLRVLLCLQCGYATLFYIVSHETRYAKNEYSYTSSNSPVAIAHFQDLAREAAQKAKMTKDDLVLDIGSNTGTLLESFRNILGCKIIGIEPSENIARLALKNSIPTINHFFDAESVSEILSSGKAKIIICTNVFNHITDLSDFMQNVRKLLEDDGMFIFEVPYLLHLVSDVAFDTIYLEHTTYFGIKPFVPFFKNFGFNIIHLAENNYMGGSIRLYVSKSKEAADIDEYIKREEESGMYDPENYKEFMSKARQLKFDVLHKIYQIKSQGEKIVGIGAATKGNTFLNYCKIDHTLLDFVTDSSPLKIGKYTPGSHIPIRHDNDITEDIKHALILPWNIAGFLKEKLQHHHLNFITPNIQKKYESRTHKHKF